MPWLSYWDHTDEDVRVAHDPGGGWSIETLFEDSDDLAESSLAIDSSGGVHVVYPRSTGGLWHSSNASGAWVDERMDDFGFGSSLAADGDGGLHVVYYDAFDGGIYYAHCP